MMDAGDLLDRALAAVGIAKTQWWLVNRGNGVGLVEITSRTAIKAQPGDRVALKGGGWVERIASDSWIRWRYIDPGDHLEPLTGQVLQGPPGRYKEQNAGAPPETPA